MKRYLFIFIFILSAITVRGYNEYQYIHSIDRSGEIVKRNTFPRIIPIILSSSASYMYMGLGGVWLNSPVYNWGGFQNGWYVYTLRLGVSYGYFLISKDKKRIRIQTTYDDGVTDEYVQCDPNEKMNNAPTY